MDDGILEVAFTRRSQRSLDHAVGQLHDAGLTWVTLQDVVGHLAAVAEWQLQRSRADAAWVRHSLLVDLCARTGWPLPTEPGPDRTTPAAYAVFEARRRLESAMLADNRAGVSANQIAERARNAVSRPVALKMLAGARLLDDATRALIPWFERDVPLHLWPGPSAQRDAVELTATWEGEDESTRREQLVGVDDALAAAGLAMRDRGTKARRTSEDLIPDDRRAIEVHRIAQPTA